jgi:glycosyltransferase involved in cell wall biosynthesis
MESKIQTILPVISVVIPVKNGQPYISRTLESVINSKSPNFRIEIIVIDNHSIDGTSEYLNNLKSTNLKVLRPKESLPIQENWTLAVNSASGSFIKLLCADDILDSECLRSQFEILNSAINHDVLAVFGTRNIIDEFDQLVWGAREINLPKGPILGIEALEAIARTGTNILGEPLTALFRADALKSSMPWPAEHPYMLDLGGYLPTLLTGKIYISNIECGSYRAHNGTLSRALRKSQASQYLDFMIKLPLDLNFFELSVMRMKAKIQQFKRRIFFVTMRYKVGKKILIKITETLNDAKK